MRSIIFLLVGGVSVWVTSNYGLPGLLIAYFFFAFFGVSGFFILRQRKHVKTLERYGKLIEPIYIIANPYDSEDVKSTYLKAKQQEKLLLLSGNKFSKVVPIFFRDHENPIETPEEYLLRVEQVKAQDKAQHLQRVYKSEGWEFYAKNILHQVGM